jgi:UDP-4-amino-4,6-dideoxy-N-acetyl-beta-L-altrosamine N-acetyltransferase
MAQAHEFRLRDMVEEDLETVLEWRNQSWIRANMYTDHVISLDEHRAWFSRAKLDPAAVYLVCECNGKPIGCVNFVHIDRGNHKAFWGFYLGEENGPKGRGSAMEFLALEYAFGPLDLRKLCAEVFSFNDKVVSLHGKFGFQQEGLYRQHVLKDGQYQDVVAIALFRDDWMLLREKMEKICFRGKG